MIRIQIFVLFFIVLSSCENNKPISDKIINSKTIIYKDWKDSYNISMGNPDTSLAIFLWKDTSLDFEINTEQYIRYGLEKNKIDNVIRTIYNNDVLLKYKIQSISKHLDKFDKYVLSSLNDNIRNDTVFLSMEVDYFSKRFPKYYKDSFLNKYNVFIW